MSVMPSNPSPTPSTSSTPSTPSARSPYKSTYLWGLPNHADPLDARSSGVARRISVQQHMIPVSGGAQVSSRVHCMHP